MVVALLAVCALGSAPAFAQLPVGPEVTVPLPVDEGGEGSTPDLTTTTTTAPPTPPSTTPTAAPAPATTPAPALGTAEAPQPSSAGAAETTRRSASTGRRPSGRVRPKAESTGTFDVAPAVAEDKPAIARLRQVTLPAARQFGFPLGLAALVLLFLAMQSRLDARDPKLAAAPLSVDDDLLPFA